MKVLSLLTLFFAASQAFEVKKPTGRRAFLDVAGAAFISAGTVALVTKEPAVAVPAEATSDKMSMCELENPFDIPNIASCHGEKKGMTPSQEAGTDSLLTKFNIQPGDIKSE